MKNIFTLIILFCFSIGHSQKIDPKHIKNLCSNQNIQGTTPTSNQYNNLFTPCSFQPLSTAITFYYVEIESGTTFTFEISPTAPVDFDFASWKNPNLQNLGIADRGSQNTVQGVNIYDIGLSLNEPLELCEGAGVAPPNTGVIPGMVRYYDVQPGDGILIAIDHWESSVVGYELSFGGDAVLNCSIVPKEFEACDYDHDGVESFDLDEIKNNINNATSTFVIDFFENETDANNVNATNSLSSPYDVSINDSPKIIYARFKRKNGLLARVAEVTLIVNEVAKIPDYPLQLLVCKVNPKGPQIFNLTDIEPEINNHNTTQPTYKYYESEQEALNNSANNITNPTNYSSSTKTIYIQISVNDKCPIVVPLKLIADGIKVTSKIIEYSEFCATVGNDGLTYDVTKTLPYLIDNQNLTSYFISIHNSLNDANRNINPINNSSNYFLAYNEDKTLYVRIENEIGCYVVSEINLLSRERLKINDQYNTVCEPYILKNLPKGYRYYTKPNGQGKILDPNSKDAIIYGKRTIYIYGSGLIDTDDSFDFNKCIYETEFTVYNNDCLIPKGFSPNGDGLNDRFDLTPFNVLSIKIFNRQGALVFKYGEGYTNQWDGSSLGGSVLPTGTYFYQFESLNGPKNGWVQLMREH
ncbi:MULTISPECIES: gliding motility-associated C-terminal domain-containing protein [unclassified Flavobacterium]|uniref:T9SS type B sorting domain-containing protein n=1 Tax=unclassified Flavobacterium TaxID=196869 RepID=UPI0013D181AC|nr:MULTISPECIES: gliding motility-associated C-terminal domain-containing protein [unclassified Flavobacterium]MBA5792407.1 gliding motility-associated C-terminal domain-containing protein [Flavobacterium sp. xlx-221]